MKLNFQVDQFQPKELKRLDHLDSIRGLAAYAVFLSHYFAAYAAIPNGINPLPRLLDYGPLTFFYDGFAAVSIFLVLSGYVLTLKLSRINIDDIKDKIGSFLISRSIRIYAPFLFMLLASALLFQLRAFLKFDLKDFPYTSSYWTKPLNLESFLRQCFLPIQTIPANQKLIPMDWTLTVEYNISLVIPVLVLVARVMNIGLLFFVAVLVGFLQGHGFLLHFSIGILLALNFKKTETQWGKSPKTLKIVFLLFSLCLYSFRGIYWNSNLTPFFKESWLWYVNGLGAAGILVCANHSVALRKLFSFSPLVKLGKTSYSIYLLHFPILMTVTPMIFPYLNPRIPVTFWLGLVVSSTIVFAASAFTYYCIEVPSMKLARRFF